MEENILRNIQSRVLLVHHLTLVSFLRWRIRLIVGEKMCVLSCGMNEAWHLRKVSREAVVKDKGHEI